MTPEDMVQIGYSNWFNRDFRKEEKMSKKKKEKNCKDCRLGRYSEEYGHWCNFRIVSSKGVSLTGDHCDLFKEKTWQQIEQDYWKWLNDQKKGRENDLCTS